MQFHTFLLRRTPYDKQHQTAASRSMAIRLKGQTQKSPYAWQYQLKLLISIFLALWTLPFRLKSGKKATVLYFDNLDSPESQATRRYFLHKHLQPNCSDEGIFMAVSKTALPPVYFNKLSLRKMWQVHRLAWRLVFAGFKGLFSNTKVHWLWKRQTVHMAIQQILFHDPEKPQVFFFSYEPHTYLSTFLTSHLVPGHHPIIISSNSLLLRGNRYQYNPKSDFKLCSKVLEEESKCYIEKGWMQFRSVELWGLEEVKVYDTIQPSEPKFDVGIFSSASWARTKDLWRSGDIEKIRAYGYGDNPMYVRFLPILEAIVALKKEHPMTVKVYFHPFERMLMEKHGINPPYLQLLEENGVAYEKAGKSSLENFYEPKIGVSISSTILFDRLHLGLKSLYFSGEGIPLYSIDEKFMGKYSTLCFHDMEELKQKVLQLMEER